MKICQLWVATPAAQLKKKILKELPKQRFICFRQQPNLFYDNHDQCLWWIGDRFWFSIQHLLPNFPFLTVVNFQPWELPKKQQIQELCQNETFRKLMASRPTHWKWFSQRAMNELSQLLQGETINELTYLMMATYKVEANLFRLIERKGLQPQNSHKLLCQWYEQAFGAPTPVHKLLQEHPIYQLPKVLQNQKILSQRKARQQAQYQLVLKKQLLELDYNQVRLPILEDSWLTDPEKGLWELFQAVPSRGEEREENGEEVLSLHPRWEARNPEQDLCEGVVAIDFGTSSTVVACQQDGKAALLRVGLQEEDFFKAPLPEHYENPTQLEFVHLPNLLQKWHNQVYRPSIQWTDFHCSHIVAQRSQAQLSNPEIFSSILTRIKQWSLQHTRLHLRDQKTGTEIEIAPLISQDLRMELPITKLSDPPLLNPIELYAYYLGLFINQRTRGLFLEYYMSFPVTYPAETKQQILTSFYRGLQRSLPEALSYSPQFSQFRVREVAAEPAAYAACALQELDIVPNQEGIAYGVFDFGGGTSDFNFGIYRLPKEAEAAQGYEEIIEHFGANGDRYLGGELLLEYLAYLTFCHHLEICRKQHLSFTRPIEAEPFAGDELLVDQSLIARSNTQILMNHLRTFLQDPENFSTPQTWRMSLVIALVKR